MTCTQTGDQWTLNTEVIGQRINATSAFTSCRLTALLYRLGAATGTMNARFYADAGGAKGAQIGGASNDSDIAPAALTTSTAGQIVTFNWSANCPSIPAGPFWIDIVRSTTTGAVDWKSGGNGSQCAGGTGFDVLWTQGDTNQDFTYTIYEGSGCAGATSTPTQTASPTPTPSASPTPTQLPPGCNAGTGNLTCAQTGDQWTLNTEVIGQRINATSAFTSCRLTARLYRVGAATGTMNARFYADASGAKGAQIGGASNDSDIAPAALTTSTAGQIVTFNWSANCPSIPAGAFWIDIVRSTTTGAVDWKSGGNGSQCAGGTGFDVLWTQGDTNQDFTYTIYEGSGCAP